MIRGRGHRPYRPPQLLTGHIDDFPLVPETPITLPSRFDQNRDPERPSGTEGRPIPQPPEATPPPSGGPTAKSLPGRRHDPTGS